jgi:GH25 family lysozyme M1 (1,4-beta-N-acetylmuramidase)
VLRIGATVVAAGTLTGAMTGVAGASTAATTASNPPLSVLRAQAAKHFAGYELPRFRATVPPSAVKPAAGAAAATSTFVYGQDVSSGQGNVNWAAQWRAGSRFAYVKATEGSYYVNPFFGQQYAGSYKVGMIRGAYAFANPSYSSGATQANYFVSHGGGWSADGRTLPGALDIEYNPYGQECYNKSWASMKSWIGSFLGTYHTRTHRWPVIYSTTDWWRTCTGNWGGTATNDPLWIARYGTSTPGTLPAGYHTWTIWQYASSGTFAGDQDKFNGTHTQLVAFAK